MKRVLSIVCAAFLLATPAMAQSSAQPVVPGSLTTSGCPGGGTPCFNQYSNANPLPVTQASGGSPQIVTGATVVAVPSTQRGLAIATATAPTIPATATYILAQAQGTNNAGGVCLYWQDDGTNPTAGAGQALAAGASMWRKVSADGIKFIAATGATCTVTLSYYKDA